uniref:Uncharacterized protein n=1 Tax=Anguilla anguilla TaxID=7936 RepID=A0A0E9S440_ANGAN
MFKRLAIEIRSEM